VTFPIAGVAAGHWTGHSTGVTVLLFPDGAIGAGEVRGGAPATREFALLEPTRTVSRVDAVVVSGGSAFGLASADGVMQFMAERGQGFATAGGPVPIVPAVGIFDLVDRSVRPPSATEGYAAAAMASRGAAFATGRVGAGCGATVGKWRGREFAVPGGVGLARGRVGDATVAAIAVVNAVGDVVADDGTVLAGSTAPEGSEMFPDPRPFEESLEGVNTTIVVVVTDGQLDKVEATLLAQSAHGGLDRTLHPAHTRFDGDATIAVATGTCAVNIDRLRAVAADVVVGAVRDAVASPGAPR
jgi:L-aminopeptidase/D-esterase-like protein